MRAFTRVFCDLEQTGRRGQPRLVPVAGLLLGQVIKHHVGRRVVGITCRVVRGTAAAIAAVLLATGTGTGINTASTERRNATCRGALSALRHHGRASAHAEGTLTAGVYLVGFPYNFCRDHDSLQHASDDGCGGLAWRPRIPALAAGLTGHRWMMRGLLSHLIPLRARWPPNAEGIHPSESSPS